MNKEKENHQAGRSQTTENTGNKEKGQHSSAFNEREPREEKSNSNPEEEADLEQQRKEALTERD